ncbi:MAG: O-antigen ligase family protein [Schleiferiaceae bacterium]|nr:O-antigen ligase family protein [Schleiferiaceae bacterium]
MFISQRITGPKAEFGLYGLTLMALPLGQGRLSSALLLLLLFVGLFRRQKSEWRYALRQPLVWVSAAFYLCHLASLLYTADLTQAGRELETKVSFLLGPVLLLAYGQNLKLGQLWRLRLAYVLGNVAVLLAALCYAAYRALGAENWFYVREGGTYQRYFFHYETFSEPFMHPGYLATYVGLAVLILLYGLYRGRWQRPGWAWAGLALMSLGLLLLQGRMNLLALMLVLGVAGVAWVRHSGRLRWLVYAGLLAGLVGWGFYTWAPDSLLKRYLALPNFEYQIDGNQFNSATYRLAEWRCASEALKEAPWLGYGVGDSQQALEGAYRELHFWKGLEGHFNAHNQYLETWLAVGLPGVLLLLLLLALYLRRFAQEGRWDMVAALVFLALCMLTESMLERAWAVVLFNVLFPLLAASGKRADKQTEGRTGS